MNKSCVLEPEDMTASATTMNVNSYLFSWCFLASFVAMATAAATRL